ncbi:MAG: prepilin-type N-terminal cleavage/methylation domain-containing protein [Candidatus Sungbacteria bacterium]|uniref:Prepilin-type N-terminal cleavage/methylation domain-containing protein n=1 Tax=Candidatus Sungiibacteriota bacterium TaxID=2750080 RepID=A0A932DS46_9BACT|nr:prepilin-type N-terminal cleavage/methylation domain-containing protein [Candidatus Sungbacteria bacterium]
MKHETLNITKTKNQTLNGLCAPCSKFYVPGSKFHVSGFTLIEAIVAIGVISVGFVGSLVLLSKSSAQASLLKNRVAVSHLAAEGIEVVRNIRDTNWLKGFDWRTGLADTASGIVDYDSAAVDASDTSDGRKCLNWSGSFYKHAVAADSYACNTTFKRHIELATKLETVSGQNVNYLEVKSIVEWREKTRAQTVTVVDHLYDWK